MILKAASSALPHMFLRGFRAPAGGAVYDPAADAVSSEEVGVFVARSMIDGAGQPIDPLEVATEDKPYQGAGPSGPFVFEADIALAKPRPDVVVVHGETGLLLDGTPFGLVDIDRGAGFVAPEPRAFGWAARNESPGRGDLAGAMLPADKPYALPSFDGALYKLPDGFHNAFWNGTPPPVSPALAGPLLSAGDRVRFVDQTGVPVTTDVVIPPGPTLAATLDGAPLDPPLDPVAFVDTVVMVRAPQSILLLWRATFPWEARFEDATLEVS